MSTVFSAGVEIHLVDKVSGALAHVAKQFTSSSTAAQALQARLDKIRSTFNSGLIMVGGGMALAAPLVAATKSAMQLESALARVKIQTGASDAQMKLLNATFDKTANATGIFSKPTLAKFASEMYSSGISNVNQINALLPIMAKAADVTKLMSGGKIGANDTLHTLTALAHQFGKYDTKSMTDMANAAVAMSLQLPGGMKSLLGTGSTVNVPGNRMLGIDPLELMAFQAAVAQTSGSTGAGGKGRMSAANQVNALTRAMPGMFGAGLLSGKSGFAAAVLGLGDHSGAATTMKNGKFDFMSFQKTMTSFEKLSGIQIAARMKANVDMLGKKAPDEMPLINAGLKGKASKAQLMAQLMTWQFGSASTIAQLIGDEKFVGVQNRLRGAAQNAVKGGGIEKMQDQVMKTLDAQLQRLQTNFGTLSSTIGKQMIPVITPLVKNLGDIVDRVNTFASAHPKIVQTAVGLVSLASGALILGGAAQIASAGFMGLKLVLPILSKGLGPVSIAIAALAFTMDHWQDIMKFVNQHSGWFIVQAGRLSDVMDTAGQVAKKVGDWVVDVINKIGGVLSKIPLLGQFGENIKKMADGMFNVSDKDVLDAKKKMLARGQAGIIQAIQGTSAAQGQVNMGETVGALKNVIGMNRGGPTVVHAAFSPTYNISADMDMSAVKQLLKDSQKDFTDHTLKTMAKDMAHQRQASSGSSVGSSINQRGSGRS